MNMKEFVGFIPTLHNLAFVLMSLALIFEDRKFYIVGLLFVIVSFGINSYRLLRGLKAESTLDKKLILSISHSYIFEIAYMAFAYFLYK